MLGLSFNLFSQTQPTRPDPTKINQENIVKKVLSFECPSTVQIGFKNANPGWTEGMGGRRRNDCTISQRFCRRHPISIDLPV